MDEPPDLVLDFCGDDPNPDERTLRILFDGVPGDAVLFGALLAGRMPVIELEEAHSGQVLARGAPCADNAGSITDALECVLARVITLVLAVAGGGTTLSSAPSHAPRSARLHDLVAFEARSLAHNAIRRLYKLCCYAPHWRTCWRFLDGPNLWQSKSVVGTAWNVISDPGFRFYADPFPFVHADTKPRPLILKRAPASRVVLRRRF